MAVVGVMNRFLMKSVEWVHFGTGTVY